MTRPRDQLDQHDQPDPPDNVELSADDRRLLAAWPAPTPRPDFVARTVARAERERGGQSTRGMAAVAALTLLMIGGFFTARFLGDHQVGVSPGAAHRLANADGGVRPEVTPSSDRIDI